MNIEIEDDQTIKVFGETGEIALEEATRLMRIIGNERWVSFSELNCGEFMLKPEYRYNLKVKFKKAP
jgi:hypothetical protein